MTTRNGRRRPPVEKKRGKLGCPASGCPAAAAVRAYVMQAIRDLQGVTQ